MFGDHTFFALIAAVLLILFALKARGALAKAVDPLVLRLSSGRETSLS